MMGGVFQIIYRSHAKNKANRCKTKNDLKRNILKALMQQDLQFSQGRRGYSHIKVTGVLVEFFESNP